MTATASPRQASSTTGKLKAFAVNSLLVLVSTLLCYLVLEIAFYRVLLPDARFSPRPFLPETPGVLVQTTKAGYAPHHYVAILGDSYAEGVGDEMLQANGDDARLFHAAHVIHTRTGRDVVTFGQGGAGSAEAFVRLPTRAIEGSRCVIFPTIEDPAYIFAYFYEGNDIDESLALSRKIATQYGRADTGVIDRFLSEQYGRFASWRCHFFLGDNISRMARFVYEYKVKKTNPFVTSETNRNTFVIAGKETPTPAVLGPALAVAPEDIRTAIGMFDRSLAWLRRRFASAPVVVVHIPSPLSTYRLAAPTVTYLSIEDTSYHPRESASARVTANSDLLCGLVREAAVRHGTGFLDARPALRAAAAARPIHGPIDWLHFNHAGYQVFGELLARRLPDAATVDLCGAS
jgi:hypothetical protein